MPFMAPDMNERLIWVFLLQPTGDSIHDLFVCLYSAFLETFQPLSMFQQLLSWHDQNKSFPAICNEG